MVTYKGIDRNFQFLTLEVRRQLAATSELFNTPTEALLNSVRSRDSYTDTLKAFIERKCLSYFRHTPRIDASAANLMTAINIAAINLEHIADFCVDIATEIRNLSDRSFLTRFRYRAYLDELVATLPLVSEAMSTADSTLALQLCRVEGTLNALYEKDSRDIRNALRAGHDSDDLLHCLFIVHYLKRMGDALLNIGETILFAATGEKLKLHEYLRLREVLSTQQSDASINDYSIDFAWETHSGCRIAKVQQRSESGNAPGVIFKNGQAEKVRKEHANIALWNDILPGLPPKVLDFSDGGDDAALLLEFLDGCTLRDLVLNSGRAVVNDALDLLEQTLRKVWRATKSDKRVNAHFVDQVTSRIDEVFRLHPEFVGACYEIGSFSVSSLETLLAKGRELERRLDAPIRVLVHGDLNEDNIIFNQRQRRVHLVDLYRSHESDYVQDISVLAVSNFRLPVFAGDTRGTLNEVVMRVCEFGRAFALENHDRLFDARLALALARSFITSTRFEADKEFAKAMYLRGVYLLEKVINMAPDRLDDLRISPDILAYGSSVESGYRVSET